MPVFGAQSDPINADFIYRIFNLRVKKLDYIHMLTYFNSLF